MKTNIEALSVKAKLREAIATVGYNREMFVEQGVVICENPLQIELDDDIVIYASDMIIAEHLTEHTRVARLNNSANLTEIHFESDLKLSDRVIVLSDDDTDEYFILDKAVNYDVAE